jgi:hypothetical protein
MAGYYVPSRFCMRTDGVVAAVEAAAAAASMEATDGAPEAAAGSDALGLAFVMLGGVRYFRTGDIGELMKGAIDERSRLGSARLGSARLGSARLGSARLAVRTFTADRIAPLLRISCERCERRTAHSLGLLRDSPGCRYRRVSTFSMATGTAE